MKKYFKLYEEYTRPRQFLFDVEASEYFEGDLVAEEKIAHEWEFRGEKVFVVEGSVDDESTDVTVKLIKNGVKTVLIEFESIYHFGPPGISDKDYATLKITKVGNGEKEYNVTEEFIQGLEDYSTFMQSILTMYEHTYTREGHYTGKDYGIS